MESNEADCRKYIKRIEKMTVTLLDATEIECEIE